MKRPSPPSSPSAAGPKGANPAPGAKVVASAGEDRSTYDADASASNQPRARSRAKANPDVETTRKPRGVYLSDGDIKLLRRVAIVRSWHDDGQRHGVSSVLASIIEEARPRLVAETKKRPPIPDDD